MRIMKIKPFHLMQEDRNDCGPTVIYSLLRSLGYYQKKKSIESELDMNDRGVTIESFIGYLETLGISTQLFQTKFKEDLEENSGFENINCPCIALLEETSEVNHFIIIYKISRYSILISDPAQQTLSEESIDVFKKVRLILSLDFKKNINAEKFSSKRFYLDSPFFKNIWMFKSSLISLLMLTFVISSFSIFNAGMIGMLTNEIAANLSDLENLKYLIPKYLFIFVFIDFGYLITNYISQKKSFVLSQKIKKEINSDYVISILNARNLKFQSGDVSSRLTDILNSIDGFVSLVLSLLASIITLIGVTMIMISFNASIFPVLIISSVLIYGLTIMNKDKLLFQSFNVLKSYSEFNTYLIDTQESKENIVNFSDSNNVGKRMNSMFNNYLNLSKYNFQFFLSLSSTQQLVSVLSTGVLYYICLNMVFNSELEIGFFTMGLTLCSLFVSTILSISSNQIQLFKFKSIFDRVIELQIQEPLETLQLNKDLFEEAHHIEQITFKKFTQNFDNKAVFNNLDLVIDFKESNIVFLNGDSGIGKTTLVRNLFIPSKKYKGEIKINSHNIIDYSEVFLREEILYLSNKDKFPQSTVYDYLVGGRNYEKLKIRKILEIVELDNVLLCNPYIFNENISNNEVIFSHGELQRLTLAKALLKEPKLIIIDEALSNVQKKLFSSIMQNLNGLTTKFIVINHGINSTNYPGVDLNFIREVNEEKLN